MYRELFTNYDLIEFLVIVTVLPFLVLFFNSFNIRNKYLRDMVIIGLPVAVSTSLSKIIVKLYKNSEELEEKLKQQKS
jgi:hypothetical protein